MDLLAKDLLEVARISQKDKMGIYEDKMRICEDNLRIYVDNLRSCNAIGHLRNGLGYMCKA